MPSCIVTWACTLLHSVARHLSRAFSKPVVCGYISQCCITVITPSPSPPLPQGCSILNEAAGLQHSLAPHPTPPPPPPPSPRILILRPLSHHCCYFLGPKCARILYPYPHPYPYPYLSHITWGKNFAPRTSFSILCITPLENEVNERTYSQRKGI